MLPFSEGKALALLLYALITGALLGVLWDIFRIMRIAAYGRKERPKRLFIRLPAEEAEVTRILNVDTSKKASFLSSLCVFVSDFGFCVFSAICVILLIFQLNDGEFRGFALLGAFLGFTAYYFTLGRLTVIFSDVIIKAIKKVVLFILSVTVLPIGRLLTGILRAIKSRIVSKHRKRKTKRYISDALANASKAFGISDSMTLQKAISLRKKGRYKRL